MGILLGHSLLISSLGLGAGGASQAFAWLLNLSTVAGLIAWATLCFCYIRFHRAMKIQGVSRDSLPWKSRWQPYTAWYGFIGSTIITLVAGFPVFLKGNWNTASFVSSYIGIPIFIVPIIVWKLTFRTKVKLFSILIPYEITAIANRYCFSLLEPKILTCGPVALSLSHKVKKYIRKL